MPLSGRPKIRAQDVSRTADAASIAKGNQRFIPTSLFHEGILKHICLMVTELRGSRNKRPLLLGALRILTTTCKQLLLPNDINPVTEFIRLHQDFRATTLLIIGVIRFSIKGLSTLVRFAPVVGSSEL
jgi:hypothetical protein